MRHKHRLSALGGSVLAIACGPRVPAAIVIPPPQPTSKPGDSGQADAAKRTPRKHAGEVGPPQIIRAEQLSASLLRLHFSEPLGPCEGIDPNDFRISMFTRYLNPRAGYSYAAYYDFGYRSYGQTLRFTGVQAGTLELDLSFAPPTSQSYCRQLEYRGEYAPPGVQVDGVLFLHYAAGSIPILDTSGMALQDFGADWVRAGRGDTPQNHVQVEEGRIERAGQGLVRIECGPVIPEGPR